MRSAGNSVTVRGREWRIAGGSNKNLGAGRTRKRARTSCARFRIASFSPVSCSPVLLFSCSPLWRAVQARRGLQEEGLDREMKSGDGTLDVGKGGLKVGEGQCRRSARRLGRMLGERAPDRQGGAEMALRRLEPRPDALPRAIRQSAIKSADRGFNGAGDRHLEEVPQPTGRHLQPLDLVGEPDADGPPAATASIAPTAIDPVRAKHDSSVLVETLQCAMPNQVANRLAVRTGRQLELLGNSDPFRLVAIKPTDFAHVPTQKTRILPAQKWGGV
jgi:hypothetical protein